MVRIREIDDWPGINSPWPSRLHNLYLVQEGEDGAIKVGIAAHPERRLSALQCGNCRSLQLRAVFAGSLRDCREIERVVLNYFGGRRARGEWLIADFADVLRVVRAFGEGEQP
jgi:hypothetical protein